MYTCIRMYLTYHICSFWYSTEMECCMQYYCSICYKFSRKNHPLFLDNRPYYKRDEFIPGVYELFHFTHSTSTFPFLFSSFPFSNKPTIKRLGILGIRFYWYKHCYMQAFEILIKLVYDTYISVSHNFTFTLMIFMTSSTSTKGTHAQEHTKHTWTRQVLIYKSDE